MSSNTRLGRQRPNKFALLGTTALIAAFGVSSAIAQEDTTDEETVETNVSDTTDDEARQDTVVVTGIRGALQNSQDIKRNADTFVDSITASDVSTLPDLSVAEALARVPGVVVQRFSLGASDADFPSPEGSGNLIRGLQFVRSEFNGRDAFSANGGRSLDWSSIPPELIGGVDIYKNQSADLIEGGIGGSINLRTLEPFDRDGLTAVLIADGTYTDLAEEWSPSYSAILGNRWDTDMGEFGLLGSYSSSQLQSYINGFQIGQLVPLVDPTNLGIGRDDPNATAADRIAVPAGFQARTNEVDRQRDSYYIAGQWRNPDGTLEATAKFARVENTIDSDERTLEWFHDGESWRGTDVSPDFFTTSPYQSDGLAVCNGSNDGAFEGPGSCDQTRPVSGGLFESGIISNNLRDWTGARGANFSNLGIHQTQESFTQDISLNVKWRPAEQWFVNLDAQFTEAESTLERLWVGNRFFSDFYLNPDLDSPQVALIPDPDNNPNRRGSQAPTPFGVGDAANSFLLFAADQFEDNEGDLYALRGDVEYEFANDGWFDSVKFGARYAEREQVNRSAGLNWAGVSPPWAGGGYLPYSELSSSAIEEVDFSDFFRGGVFVGDNTTVGFADRGLIQNYDAFTSLIATDPLITGDGFAPDWSPLRVDGVVDYAGRGTIGDITETTENFYGRLDFGNEFENGMSLEGNVGVRYSGTTVTTFGGLGYSAFTGTDLTPGFIDTDREFLPETAAYLDQATVQADQESNDDRWLPSLNLKWNLNDDMLVRFGYSEAITRPNVSDLRSDQNASAQLLFITDNTDPDNSVIEDIQLTRIVVNGGNPNLEPVEAVNYDVSYEWYFDDDGSFTASLFRKELDNIIIFSQQNTGSITLDGYTVPVDFIGLINQDEGTVTGIELAYQQFYDDLPGLLSNLGIQANYTYIDSEATPLPEFQDADGDGQADDFATTFRFGIDRLLGLSEHTANLVGIYQDDNLELRLAYNWRSDYVSSYRDFVTGNPIFQEEGGYLDGSVKYDINDNLQLRFLAANLLDTKGKATQQVDAAGQRYDRSSFISDRRFEIGLRYQF